MIIYKDNQWRTIIADKKCYYIVGKELEKKDGLKPTMSPFSYWRAIDRVLWTKINSLYGFVVKSKAGAMHKFNSKEEAVEFAAKRRGKTVYTVYHDGHAIDSFVNGRTMPKGKLIWSKNYKLPKISEYDGEYFKRCDTVFKGIIEYDDKVTYSVTEVIRTKKKSSDSVYSTNKTISLTFTKEGRVFYYNGQGVKGIIGNSHLAINEEAIPILIDALSKFNRLHKIVVDYLASSNLWHATDLLVTAWTRPNAVLVYDEYHNITTIRKQSTLVHSHTLMLGLPRELTDESKLVDSICGYYKLPHTKAIKKQFDFSVGFAGILDVYRIKKCGVKKIDNYLKLRDFAKINAKRVYRYGEWIAKYISVKGENLAVSVLTSQNFDDFEDTVQMFESYNIEEEICTYFFKNCGNLRELHDSVTNHVRKRSSRMVNKHINYSKTELKLNKVYDSVEFRLAADTKELALIGANMGICVGGYARAAVNKDTTIVAMINNGKYVGCIEIVGRSVQQIKAKFNNPLEAAYKADLDKWIKSNKLIVDDCEDYNRIGMKWTRNYNYAIVDPDDIVEERQEKVLEIVKAKAVPEKKMTYEQYCQQNCIDSHWDEDDELPF